MLRGNENVICSGLKEVHADQPIREPWLLHMRTGAVQRAVRLPAYRVPAPARRGSVPADSPAAYRVLLEDCWAADTVLRPTFTAILDRLTALLAAAPEN